MGSLLRLMTIEMSGKFEEMKFLQLKKSGQYSDLLPIDKSVDYKIRESKWNLLGKEMRDFLEENELNLEDYKLIE